MWRCTAFLLLILSLLTLGLGCGRPITTLPDDPSSSPSSTRVVTAEVLNVYRGPDASSEMVTQAIYNQPEGQ